MGQRAAPQLAPLRVKDSVKDYRIDRNKYNAKNMTDHRADIEDMDGECRQVI